MQELGTDLVLICSSCHPQALGGIDRAAADFHKLGERAAKRGLRIGYEALAWSHHVNDHRDAWEIVRRAEHPNVGLVLNSFHTLSSAYTVHGTTGCDIGIAVKDTAAALSRAKALGVQPFDQPVGPGELNIPAIRGLGGSVMHFIDDKSRLGDVWSVEFTRAGGAAEGVGLHSIDHLAQTMSSDEMLSWSLFHTTLFDMEKSPIVDVVDPDGLVRSQALETPQGTFRITLNGTGTHRTMAGNFLADSFGASVQHIALAISDIFATSDALAERGFAPMAMSDNYYADLAARFDLDETMLARLKAGNILYDEDTSGAFFQLYSHPFAGGMFFQIVQRQDGYAGYGAPNAPFHIAAQKRLLRPKGIPRT
jgi:4-hydroxyphenylpyruvate dioxygenase